MITSSKKIKIPPDERRFISPDIRQKLFKDLCNNYKSKLNLNLIYGYLNSDPEIMIDYCIIFKVRNNDDTGDLILFDVPPIHSDRSTPGYRYCKRTHQVYKFLEYGIDDMAVMDKNKFFEFITLNLGLTRNKNDYLYWKNPDNYKVLLQGLLDLSLRYNKRPISN